MKNENANMSYNETMRIVLYCPLFPVTSSIVVQPLIKHHLFFYSSYGGFAHGALVGGGIDGTPDLSSSFTSGGFCTLTGSGSLVAVFVDESGNLVLIAGGILDPESVGIPLFAHGALVVPSGGGGGRPLADAFSKDTPLET